MQNPNCPNCAYPSLQDHKFCPSCGQKAAVHRLSMHDVGHDALHYFTHADKGIFALLGQMAFRPGKVAREYISGKRKKYFPPLNFFLLVAAIYVAVIGYIQPADRASVISPQEQARYEAIQDPAKKAQVGAIFERRVKSMQFFNKYSNFVAMVATPLMSFFLWLFYIRGRFNYTEHLVANMYSSGFTVLCFAFIFGPIMKLLHLQGLNFVLLSYFLFEISYRAVSYYHLMGKGTVRSAVKASFSSLAVILIWTTISFILVFLYVWNGFWGLLH